MLISSTNIHILISCLENIYQPFHRYDVLFLVFTIIMDVIVSLQMILCERKWPYYPLFFNIFEFLINALVSVKYSLIYKSASCPPY